MRASFSLSIDEVICVEEFFERYDISLDQKVISCIQYHAWNSNLAKLVIHSHIRSILMTVPKAEHWCENILI
jgi:hypothetical protein